MAIKKKNISIPKFIMRHERVISLFLICVLCLSLIFSLLQKSTAIIPFHPKYWEDQYNSSQWMVKKNPQIITDEALYTYVGSLLLHGHDPSLINAEVPPFGKYVIGWFNAATGYVGIYGVVFSVLSLILFFLLNKLLFNSTLFALIPVTLLSFDPVFTDQIAVGLLDSLYFCTLLLTFIFFLKKKYYLSALTAGLFMATKSPFLIVILYLCLFIFLFLKKELNLRKFIIMPLITSGVYLGTHFQIFFLGHDFMYFLRVQKYMIHFYQIGAKGVFAAVVPLLFSGYWFTWYGDNQFIKSWSILWPVVCLGGLAGAYHLIKDKLFTSPFFFLLLWCGLYLSFLCVTPVFPRYLLLVLPFLYNLSVWVILKNIGWKL